MALNPKLNIYVVSLNPRDKNSHYTYRDLFKFKFSEGANMNDKSLMKSFFKNFIDSVGKSDFRKDDKNKKVIGVSDYNPDDGNTSLNIHSEKCVIEGLIDGGQYGVLRAFADVNNKNAKETLGTSKAVLDKFYICLSTPLNSAYGFLFVQSYTENSIQDTFSSFLKELLKWDDEFYNVRIDPYVPKKFVDKFKDEAKIRMFSFKSKIGVSDILRDEQVLVRGQAFNVNVIITPIEDDFYPGTDEGLMLANAIANKSFDGNNLGNYEDKKVFIDANGRRAHYDINKEIKSIRPTIFLEDEGIKIDAQTGQPDFNQIKDFTLSLLEEVKKEFNSYENIEEL